MYRACIGCILTFHPSGSILLGASSFDCLQSMLVADLGWLHALVHHLHDLSLLLLRERRVHATVLLPLEGVRHVEHLLPPQLVGALHCTE